jgi:hypothetical protein
MLFLRDQSTVRFPDRPSVCAHGTFPIAGGEVDRTENHCWVLLQNPKRARLKQGFCTKLFETVPAMGSGPSAPTPRHPHGTDEFTSQLLHGACGEVADSRAVWGCVQTVALLPPDL